MREVVEESLAASDPDLKPRTLQGYRSNYKNRILPEFGARRLTSTARADVQAWIAKLHSEGLSPATVHHHFVALKKAVRHAVDDRLTNYNPCDGVRLPKSHKVDDFAAVFLTSAQVESIADYLDAQAPYGLLVRFAAFTGLRAAELAGLGVGDLDLANGHVKVRQTMQRVNAEGRGHAQIEEIDS